MSVNLLTINDLRPYLAEELSGLYNEEEIGALARIIIKTIFGAEWLHIINKSGTTIEISEITEIKRISDELKTGRPYQYVLGETEFYGCRIRVNEWVLIPRPETEELVNIIINENKNFSSTITDLGTGSGCIAIALAKNIPEATVNGVDISDEALKTAKENAELNKVKVTFRKDDILKLKNIESGIIVSNPPYVRLSEKNLMHRNVLDFEPHRALFVEDDDPLVFHRAIIMAAASLTEGVKIYMEINEALGKEIYSLLVSYGYSEVSVIKDLNGKDRFVKGIFR
ncbi:MAG TPA: peptide chain release factor N(5)-glutamine methyltransferase [Bacteroidales bacterium]|nr:peptide chain release factor N(5)-glutamine methyltransferase [Bacteroidales bacterium]